MATKDTANQLRNDVEQLLNSYRRLLQMCHDALGDKSTPGQRMAMRASIKTFLEATDGEDKDGVEKPSAGD